MRVGLISDTHGPLRPEVLERLSGVDHILHAGDIGPPTVLTDLASLAPVSAVWGNTDGWEVRALTEETLEVDLGCARFGVAHGHTVPEFDALPGLFRRPDVIVHGHSHVPRVDRRGDVLIVNPGSAGPGGEGWPPTIGIADIGPDRLVEVVHLEIASGRTLDL